MFESHPVRKYSYVYKVQHTFNLGTEVLSDILETCDVRWKTNSTRTHTAHYLKSLIPAYLELLYVHLIGLHGYVSRTTLYRPNKLE
jgi:hypothetical protein